MTHLSELILVDLNRFFVEKNLSELRSHVPQIVGHYQGRCKYGPHCHLYLGLLVTQPVIPDYQLKEGKIPLITVNNSPRSVHYLYGFDSP